VQEAATYIMTYKAFEHKPPDMLKERVQKDYPSQLQNVLTSVKGVNKTDVITLSTNFGVSRLLNHLYQIHGSLIPFPVFQEACSRHTRAALVMPGSRRCQSSSSDRCFQFAIPAWSWFSQGEADWLRLFQKGGRERLQYLSE